MAEEEVVAGGGVVREREPAAQPTTFAKLGICRELVEACDAMGWKEPTRIQAEAIPHALEGRDLIGLGQTGSGKTGAFALPIIQALLEHHQPFFACVMSPTRELAIQIGEQFEALGSAIGLRCSVLVGGVDRMQQVVSLAKRPHIVVGAPGRLLDHLKDTKGSQRKVRKTEYPAAGHHEEFTVAFHGWSKDMRFHHMETTTVKASIDHVII